MLARIRLALRRGLFLTTLNNELQYDDCFYEVGWPIQRQLVHAPLLGVFRNRLRYQHLGASAACDNNFIMVNMSARKS
jgi:hypothetical protein